jgi:hypothetical protein
MRMTRENAGVRNTHLRADLDACDREELSSAKRRDCADEAVG